PAHRGDAGDGRHRHEERQRERGALRREDPAEDEAYEHELHGRPRRRDEEASADAEAKREAERLAEEDERRRDGDARRAEIDVGRRARAETAHVASSALPPRTVMRRVVMRSSWASSWLIQTTARVASSRRKRSTRCS